MKFSTHNLFGGIKTLSEKPESKATLSLIFLFCYFLVYALYIVPFLSHLEVYLFLFPNTLGLLTFDSLYISYEMMIDLVKAFAFIVATFPLFSFATVFIRNLGLIPDGKDKEIHNVDNNKQ
ncbi:hypothetical protein [Salinicola aestuarinus]|uniref:hypothetical protein n=1 Tax=Salinicola aestuarinus TaxID=1949082 RepID=UPI00130088A8|nr:hypothetical protein [Salinicola aestuarinus]